MPLIEEHEAFLKARRAHVTMLRWRVKRLRRLQADEKRFRFNGVGKRLLAVCIAATVADLEEAMYGWLTKQSH